MDDDTFADLLRNQSAAAAPALPSFYQASSPTLDPYANPFAEDANGNPFADSKGVGSSALPSINAFGGSSSVFASDEVGASGDFPSRDGMPTLAEREEDNEARGRAEEVTIAERAGDGVVEVSPYLQRLEEPGAYGADQTGGFDGKEEIRSTVLEGNAFGTVDSAPAAPVSAFSGGFQEESTSYPIPFNTVPTLPTFTDPYAQEQSPFTSSAPYDPPQSTGFASYAPQSPTYPSTHSPHHQSSSFIDQISPARNTRSPIPAALVAPPSEMLGVTASDSLKAAFVKRSSSVPLLDELNSDPSSSAKATTITSPPSATTEHEKKPYIFKPGGSIKRRKGEGIRQGNHTRTPSALASAPAVTAQQVLEHVPPPVPEKDVPTTSSAGVATSITNGTSSREVAHDDAQPKTPRDAAAPSNGTSAVSAQLAEQIMTSSDPQKASQAVAEHVLGNVTRGADDIILTKIVDGDDMADTLRMASEIPLPGSDAGTPRSGTPVPIAPAVVDEPEPTLESDQNDRVPRPTSGVPPTSSHSSKFDRVAVSPLTSDPPSARTQDHHHFQALSIGASSPAMPSAEAQSTPTHGRSDYDTSSTPGRQTSWGRAYDEPPSPVQISPSRIQPSQATSPAMQGWTTDVPHAAIPASALSVPTSQESGGSGWSSAGYESQPLGGATREDGVTAEAWGGGDYTSPQRAELEDSPVRNTMPRSSSSTSVKEGARTRLMDQPMFTITLSDPTKVGDPIRGHIVYTVTTRTTSPHYRRAECSVLRRFSDFLWLFEAVSANNPGVIVPPVPDKHAFGRFEEQFVETRRAALEGSLRKMANHPVLALDQDLRLFLESDSFALEIKHRRQEMTQEKQGLLAGLKGPKFTETDDWFDHRKTFLDALEIQLKSLTRSIEASSKHRLDLAVLIDRLGDSVAQLAESDLAVDLSAALQRLSGLNKKEKEMLETQAKMDVIHLMNCAEEYIRLIGSVRLAFASRIKSYFNWQNVEADAKRLKSQHEKLRRANKIPQDRIQSALADLSDADRRTIDARSDYDAVTRLVKIEFARFEAERIMDFKSMLERYLDGMIERQKEFVNAWEGYHAILARMMQTATQS